MNSYLIYFSGVTLVTSIILLEKSMRKEKKGGQTTFSKTSDCV